MMEVRLANPRGFCAGVDRAIDIVRRALDLFGAPVYVRHEVVHNRTVVAGLRERGAIFVESLCEVPDDVVLVFSAHGVPRSVREAALTRGLKVFDATCPLVTKVHMEVARYADEGIDCVLIGHAGHPEVEGTMGQYHTKGGGRIDLVENLADVGRLQIQDPDRVGYVTQTTLSVDDTEEIIAALRKRFPNISGPKKDDICYATQNRQDAVRQLASECDVMLVVGSTTSSNSNRLRELAERCGARAYLIDTCADIEEAWLEEDAVIGVTAGASAPEELVVGTVDFLVERGARLVGEVPGIAENIRFALPSELRRAAPQAD